MVEAWSAEFSPSSKRIPGREERSRCGIRRRRFSPERGRCCCSPRRGSSWRSWRAERLGEQFGPNRPTAFSDLRLWDGIWIFLIPGAYKRVPGDGDVSSVVVVVDCRGMPIAMPAQIVEFRRIFKMFALYSNGQLPNVFQPHMPGCFIPSVARRKASILIAIRLSLMMFDITFRCVFLL